MRLGVLIYYDSVVLVYDDMFELDECLMLDSVGLVAMSCCR